MNSPNQMRKCTVMWISLDSFSSFLMCLSHWGESTPKSHIPVPQVCHLIPQLMLPSVLRKTKS